MALFRDIVGRVDPEDIPLITTDGFEFYERVVWQAFGRACVYGQVLKTRRNNRIVKVERRTVIGTGGRLEEKLQRSEDSSTLNTSFIERLNLTIRQGSAYLCRRTICHARWKQRLEGHLELLRCYYNFVRPHRALKFGRDIRAPAMQAGLTGRPLTLREIFCSGMVFASICKIVVVFQNFAKALSVENAALGGLNNIRWRKHRHLRNRLRVIQSEQNPAMSRSRMRKLRAITDAIDENQ